MREEEERGREEEYLGVRGGRWWKPSKDEKGGMKNGDRRSRKRKYEEEQKRFCGEVEAGAIWSFY